MSFKLTSPADIMRDVAGRAKALRLEANMTQKALAGRANTSLGTLKLFEASGKVSFETLLKIAFALDAEGEFELLFPARPPRSIDDVIDKPKRERARGT